MENTGWEYEAAYKLVDLYVKELTERRDKKALDLEGIVEAYLYVLGRLNAGKAEIGHITEMIEQQMAQSPESPDETGMTDAVGGKKLNADLLKALEGMK